MRLFELVKTQPTPVVDLANYERKTELPPLTQSKLKLEALVKDQRSKIKMPIEGQVAVVLSYKGMECATSLDENSTGTTWTIKQVQGAKGAYRLITAMRWPQVLGTVVKRFTQMPSAEVKYITMPPLQKVTNIEDAASVHIDYIYSSMANALGMQFSEIEDLYIAEIVRK